MSTLTRPDPGWTWNTGDALQLLAGALLAVGVVGGVMAARVDDGLGGTDVSVGVLLLCTAGAVVSAAVLFGVGRLLKVAAWVSQELAPPGRKPPVPAVRAGPRDHQDLVEPPR